MTPPTGPDDPGRYPTREESLGRVLSKGIYLWGQSRKGGFRVQTAFAFGLLPGGLIPGSYRTAF